MIFIHLTEEGTQAYLTEHKGVDAILNQLVNRIGCDRALLIAQELSEITGILDEIVPNDK